MAEVKLFSEFRSSHGHFYLIEIYDEDYTGTSPDQFNVTGDGFQLTYSGETDNIYSPIIGSSVSFGMYVKDSATTTFLNNLKQYQQDRYFVKIWKGEFDGQDANTWYNTTKVSDDGLVMAFSPDEEEVVYLDYYWGGYIVQDIIEVEDVSQPYVLNIQATDGISKLKDTLCGTSFFRVFTNQFINALDQAGVMGIYGSEHPVLAVVCDWWAQEMTYSTSTNPLDDTWVDFHAFDIIDEQGFYTNKNWYEILSQLCTIFGLRFYFSNGQYRLEQLFLRDSSFAEHTYKKDKTKIQSQSGVFYNKTIDQTSNKARLSGNIFNFLPAVNDVSITLNQEPKAMKGVTWDNSNDPDLEMGLISSALQNQLTLVFNHQIKLFLSVNVNQNNIFAKLRLNVELYDFDNNVTYYLKRKFTGMTPSAPVWTTTQSGSGYEVLIGTFQEFSGQVTLGNTDVIQIGGPTTIVTPPIPEDGDMTINWDFVGFVESNGSVRGLNIGNSSTYKMTLQSVDTSFGSIQNQTTRIRAVSPNADINGLVSYELPETSIFTGQGERGSIVRQYEVSGILLKIPYTNWREGNSGSYITIQKLICQEFLKLMDAPVQKYMGRMFSSHDFRQRLTFDSNNWIQLGGTYSANMDEWDGEWFVISRAAITPTFDDVVIVDDSVNLGNVNGSTGGVSFDGVESVNISTNALGVTTNADVGGALDVTGDTTLGAGLTHEGFLVQNIVDVTNSAGSTYDVTDTDYMIFNTWSGTTGTATINLPIAGDNEGRLLRFKSDGTIAANKIVNLVPQSGETIDGASEFAFSRDYDGVMILAHNDAWYIIQRKAK